MSILVPVLRERYYSSGPMKELKDKLVLLHLPTSLGFGLLGGIVFMTYFPERFYTKDTLRGKSPPKLGIFFQYFNSHSIMHVMVFASAWIWDTVVKASGIEYCSMKKMTVHHEKILQMPRVYRVRL